GSDTPGFDDARGQPCRLERLQAVLAERQLVAARGLAADLAAHLLAPLRSLGHQHRHGSSTFVSLEFAGVFGLIVFASMASGQPAGRSARGRTGKRPQVVSPGPYSPLKIQTLQPSVPYLVAQMAKP